MLRLLLSRVSIFLLAYSSRNLSYSDSIENMLELSLLVIIFLPKESGFLRSFIFTDHRSSGVYVKMASIWGSILTETSGACSTTTPVMQWKCDLKLWTLNRGLMILASYESRDSMTATRAIRLREPKWLYAFTMKSVLFIIIILFQDLQACLYIGTCLLF